MRGVVLLLAAGGGVRLLAKGPKAFVNVGGVPIVRRAADAACAAELVDELVVAVPAGTEDEASGALAGAVKPVRVVTGGPTRQASAAAALAAVGDPEAIVVHDAARALCPPEYFDLCLGELDRCEAVCVGLPVRDTIKEVENEIVRSTLDRSHLVAAQTPQAFRSEVYRRAHDAAARDGVVATDDAALVERLGVAVRIIPGLFPTNIKITTPGDLQIAEALLAAREAPVRSGIGFDVHRFDPDRPLVLGGVTIPGASGLAGHSDADVLCHAVADALLGAANLGDLGTHFPDTDPAWKDASSLEMLGRVKVMLSGCGYDVASIDATVVLESPKIGSYRGQMCSNIARALRIDVGRVSVKATTTEGLGLVGRGEGAACMAVAVLQRGDD